MALLFTLHFTATKRINSLLFLIEIEESLVRILMSRERKFRQGIQWLFPRLLLRRHCHGLLRRQRLLHLWLQILLFLPLKKKKKRPLLPSDEFYKRLGVQVDKSFWLCEQLKSNKDPSLLRIGIEPNHLLQIGPSLLRMDPMHPIFYERIQVYESEKEIERYVSIDT